MIIKETNIHPPILNIVLAVRSKILKIGCDEVYFNRANTALGYYVRNDASPFAAALLLPAMKQGKDVIIEGSISRQLYQGMQAIMQEALQWNIGLRPIKIEAAALVADPPPPRRSASFFSGGVDSFYTYLKHKTDPVKTDRIDSFILINGFDIKRGNLQLWDRSLTNIKSIAKADNVQLIVVRSNIQHLVEPILLWDYSTVAAWRPSDLPAGAFTRSTYHDLVPEQMHGVRTWR
jgi:hypothetical protein